ncbi:MAG: hypothetical protein HGA21_07010 [Burkholderiaceae bacterium]|nr:hypothetical protein [Burkholderiaceae bacterium]
MTQSLSVIPSLVAITLTLLRKHTSGIGLSDVRAWTPPPPDRPLPLGARAPPMRPAPPEGTIN